jgi:L-aminopeptidase/D-esterase-like protein
VTINTNFPLSVTAIPGVRVGHAHDAAALTGCTVILCPPNTVGGVDQRGGAPGTRETDSLQPMHLVQEVHALVLAGGSAFGLDAAGGVMRYLEEQGVGFDVGVAKVPIVPSAILFDLEVGRADVRPDAAMGYAACLDAAGRAPGQPEPQGSVGAGMGASVGKLLGIGQAMRGGLGSVCLQAGELLVGALVAVNPFGDVIDPNSGQIVAGARNPAGTPFFADSLATLAALTVGPLQFGRPPSNTVIGAVVTNAQLSKEAVNKVAQMAQDGLARTVRPAHTMFDGDTLFALATGPVAADVSLVGALAAEAVAAAILTAVRQADSLPNLPAAAEVSSS